MRQHHPLMFQLHAEKSAWELLKNRAGYFDTVFFTQSNSFSFEAQKCKKPDVPVPICTCLPIEQK